MSELDRRAERENETAAYWLLYCYEKNDPDWIALAEEVEAGLSVRDQIILRLRRKYRHRRGPLRLDRAGGQRVCRGGGATDRTDGGGSWDTAQEHASKLVESDHNVYGEGSD